MLTRGRASSEEGKKITSEVAQGVVSGDTALAHRARGSYNGRRGDALG
jgi:hypothetical protein